MNKELSDRVWSVLPKEFKEKVKYYYQHTDCGSYAEGMLESIFGEHNLTSDAEGEEEMLCVSRKRVQNIYAQCEKVQMDDNPNLPAETIDAASTKMALLSSLFGSKCLPDEVAIAENATTTDPKPAKPKFKVGDKVRISCAYKNGDIWDNIIHGRVVTIKSIYRNATNNYIWMYQFEEGIRDFSEGWLSLYPDQEYEKGNLPTIDDRRLNIAAMILSGLLASGKDKHPVKRALELTDSLISECRKDSRPNSPIN